MHPSFLLSPTINSLILVFSSIFWLFELVNTPYMDPLSLPIILSLVLSEKKLSKNYRKVDFIWVLWKWCAISNMWQASNLWYPLCNPSYQKQHKHWIGNMVKSEFVGKPDEDVEAPLSRWLNWCSYILTRCQSPKVLFAIFLLRLYYGMNHSNP